MFDEWWTGCCCYREGTCVFVFGFVCLLVLVCGGWCLRSVLSRCWLVRLMKGCCLLLWLRRGILWSHCLNLLCYWLFCRVVMCWWSDLVFGRKPSSFLVSRVGFLWWFVRLGVGFFLLCLVCEGWASCAWKCWVVLWGLRFRVWSLGCSFWCCLVGWSVCLRLWWFC